MPFSQNQHWWTFTEGLRFACRPEPRKTSSRHEVTAVIRSLSPWTSVFAIPITLLVTLNWAMPHEVFGAPSDQQCTFQTQPAEPGQRVWQHVTATAQLTTVFAQASQTISQVNRFLTREQVRRLKILPAAATGTQRVAVTYEKAVETISERGGEPERRPQPVETKTYVVARHQEELQVRYADDRVPPNEEIEIVRRNMSAVGKPHALSKLLAGRTVKVGDRLDVPPHLAAEMVGWRDEYGEMADVELSLLGLEDYGGRPCARFACVIRGTPRDDGSQTKMRGELHVEIDTCRALGATMNADLATREQRGPQGFTFEVRNRGAAQVHQQDRYY